MNMLLAAYARRIQVEEAVLARQLDDPYRVYMQETWRLEPSLY
jgi:protein-S-isoprenylcysteine O-methyltransferase Ste14